MSHIPFSSIIAAERASIDRELKRLRRRYLGIELDDTYYREATARIARMQKRITDKRPSPSI
jgi:hypothetical protein